MQRQMVTHVIESAHSGMLVDHVILEGTPPPTPEPIVEEYRKDGKLLYRHVHGLAYGDCWFASNGKELEWYEVPEFYSLEKFYSMFGQDTCQLR